MGRTTSAIDSAEQELKASKNDAFLEAKKLSGKLLSKVAGIFHALFRPVGITSLKKGRASAMLDVLKDVGNRVEKGSKIIGYVETGGYDNEAAIQRLGKDLMDEAYIVWDNDLGKSLDTILTNLRHTTDTPIACPKELRHKGERTKAHLWMHLNIDKQYFTLYLCQRKTLNTLAEEVTKKMVKQYCVKAFTQIDGVVRFDSVDGYLQTSIQIPYAHTLGEDKGESS